MKRIIKSILDPIVFAIAIYTLLLSACARKVYVPTETVIESRVIAADTTQSEKVRELIDRLQSTLRTQEKVVVRDSVVLVVNEQGAVVTREVYHDRDRDYTESEAVARVTQIYDSLYQRQTERADSILNEYRKDAVVVEVEKSPSLWQRIKDGAAITATIAIFVGIFLLLRKIKSKNNY